MATDSNDMIFNNVFQTLKIDCPALIIPLANELHGTQYTKEDEVSLNHNEHFRKRQDGLALRSTDSNLLIGSGEQAERYHFECQRRPDGTMIKRMVEYDILIAMEHGQTSPEGMQMKMPHAGVVYLEHTKNTPDEMELKMEMSDVDGLHKIPSLKVQNYSVDELFSKQLYLLIPFYILVYKNGKVGIKDIVTNDYIKKCVVFADAFNQHIYKGEQVIRPENLRPLDTAIRGIPYGAGTENA